MEHSERSEITGRDDLSGRLLSTYLTLLGLLIGLLGAVTAEAEKYRNSSLADPEYFLAIVVFLVFCTAIAAIVSLLSIVGIVRSLFLNICIFIAMIVAICGTAIGFAVYRFF